MMMMMGVCESVAFSATVTRTRNTTTTAAAGTTVVVNAEKLTNRGQVRDAAVQGKREVRELVLNERQRRGRQRRGRVGWVGGWAVGGGGGAQTICTRNGSGSSGRRGSSNGGHPAHQQQHPRQTSKKNAAVFGGGNGSGHDDAPSSGARQRSPAAAPNGSPSFPPCTQGPIACTSSQSTGARTTSNISMV